MIPFDFEYYKPDSVEEAIEVYSILNSRGKKVIYYGGGTEFITMSRAQNIIADAVIDYKGITECNMLGIENDKLVIGSAVTLTSIAEADLFPLLSLTVQRIADHTVQDKITLGGNVAGSIIYHEAVLPLMVSDCRVELAGPNGRRQIPLNDIFNRRMNLEDGELIVKFIMDKEYLSKPYIHVKRVRDEKIGYPLITIAALHNNNKINIAFTALCGFPFRSSLVEQCLNDKNLPFDNRISNAVINLPDKILGDLAGSADFRSFKVQKMLMEVLSKLEGMD